MKFEGCQPGDSDQVGPRVFDENLQEVFDRTSLLEKPEFAAAWLKSYLRKHTEARRPMRCCLTTLYPTGISCAK
jgi:hypothetical protein